MTTEVSKAPHFEKYGNLPQLHVDGKPFLVLGGELQNSSLSSTSYMEPIWQRMKDANLNTVLGAVTWEQVEPVEGQFDFSIMEAAILSARKHGLRLILLWFGAYKNGMSTYAPSWVKRDAKRFPRAKIWSEHGLKTVEVLSLFHPETLQADKRAFTAMMSAIRQIDEVDTTVIMVQVENEVGLLGDSRDRNTAADDAFCGEIPSLFANFVREQYPFLNAGLKTTLKSLYDKRSWILGKWANIQGDSKQVDQVFMAYHHARYLNSMAVAGRQVYDIPLFTNVWMNYNSANGEPSEFVIAGGGTEPGDYPSGGAVDSVLEIWKYFGSFLDFIAPDVYLNDYRVVCGAYKLGNQPLFIPEQRRDAYGSRRIWAAIGSFGAVGVSPFGIDTLDPEVNTFTKEYALLDSVSQIIFEARRKSQPTVGFFDEVKDGEDNAAAQLVEYLGAWKMTIARSFVFGRAAAAGGMMIQRSDYVFLLIGKGFMVSAEHTSDRATFSGILRFEEKEIVDKATGVLRTLRTLNGDETQGGKYALMPSEDPDYGTFPICVTIPARTMIAEVEFYHLEDWRNI